jgi:hypothetical protein
VSPAAPPGDAPTTKTVDQQVIELFDRGTGFYLKAQWREAEAAFQTAWDLKKSYDIAGNLGEVELKLGQARDATEHLSYSLQHFPATGKEAHRNKLQQLFEQARKEVVTLRVRVNIDGAQVLVNGRLVGQSPLAEDIYVDSGRTMLEARLAGHETATQAIESAKGWSEETTLVLKPMPQGDGGVGRGTPDGPGDAPETSPGFFDGKSLPLIIAGAGVTVGLLITGGVLTAAANGKGSDAAAQLDTLEQMALPCSNAKITKLCTEQRDTLRSQSTLANAAVAMFVVGGVAAGATAAYIFWPTGAKRAAAPPETSLNVRAAPAVGPGGGGLLLSGTF